MLDVVGKVMAIVIHGQLQKLAEEELSSVTVYVRKGRGCMDMELAVRHGREVLGAQGLLYDTCTLQPLYIIERSCMIEDADEKVGVRLLQYKGKLLQTMESWCPPLGAVRSWYLVVPSGELQLWPDSKTSNTKNTWSQAGWQRMETRTSDWACESVVVFIWGNLWLILVESRTNGNMERRIELCT